jgi:hypothetical protein
MSFSSVKSRLGLAILLIVLGPYAFGQNKPEDTEVWEPVPPIIDTSEPGSPPSDAIVLFDGTNLEAWTNYKGESAQWMVEEGVLTVAPGKGVIKTKQLFGDCQLHLEFRTPAEVVGEGQGRGNSGVFLQERYEVQILDNFDNVTYSNGQVGSVYKQHIPLANPSRKPGEWQVYDIIFTAPRFDDKGAVLQSAFVTVFLNNVVVQNHVEIQGSTAYIGPPSYKAHGERQALLLQDHGNPISFRNIWIRELKTPK